MHWRMIGPHRGGRTVAAAGVPGQPGVFYIGVNNGGVWRSDDYGRVWRPLFDDQPTGSVGALAVAPSDPNVIYVGSGEGLQRPDLSTGDGLYRSSDAGRSWEHLGLRDGQQIPAIIVDPRDANRLLVAVLGHPYGPNAERGIFRSTDGGRSFAKVLFKDENTGGMDLAFEPGNPDVVYAVLWEARQAPWENGVFSGPGSGLYKSSDGGTTWRPLAKGLPSAGEGLGRIGLATCASDPKRLYAIVGARTLGGLYRSDDAGESWRRANDDQRLWGRDGDFNEVKADPKNADAVYVANVVTWKSTDGGAAFTALRGAPGGDDYHRLWIDPADPRVILLASDQGAVISVNGGATWSSWYNQPTAQFYHVSTDNAFPYRVCGGQQESGSACVASRGGYGELTFRDWTPVGGDEYGYFAADPLDPDVVYGGRVTRFDRRTGQVQNVSPSPLRRDGYRVLRTAPLLFSPADPRVLYFASERLWRTSDGGSHWEAISGDLTRKDWTVPPNVGVYATRPEAKPRQRGVVYTVAPSQLDGNRIWAGTDDGLIQLTTDAGKTWTDVSPEGLRPWAKVSLLEASHFDPLGAYAAINTLRLDDLRPHIWRTRDGGRSWAHVTEGIPDGGIVNVVREDPKRRGLLFAGTEQAVYVSFDDGDHWQSLRLGMPASSIRDLVVKDDDLVVATHGRSFWILDDITPLRQWEPKVLEAEAHLFEPQTAVRVRWNANTDTPLPPDEPSGQNPPDGAILDYHLKAAARGPVSLEIVDAAGRSVRRISSDDVPEPPVPGRNIPDYWIRPPQRLATSAGLHRFVWDLHHPPPAAERFEYPIAAVAGETSREPHGPWALPGEYRVKLTVNGETHTQTLTVKMDPRVKTPAEGLEAQLKLSLGLSRAMGGVHDALAQVHRLQQQLAERRVIKRYPVDAAACEGKLAALAGGEGRGPGRGDEAPSLTRTAGELVSVYEIVQGADVAPATQTVAAVAELERGADELLSRWSQLREKDVAACSEALRKVKLPPLVP
jgi:photosystem II stability/assembly factor-like uncharacterized protein